MYHCLLFVHEDEFAVASTLKGFGIECRQIPYRQIDSSLLERMVVEADKFLSTTSDLGWLGGFRQLFRSRRSKLEAATMRRFILFVLPNRIGPAELSELCTIPIRIRKIDAIEPFAMLISMRERVVDSFALDSLKNWDGVTDFGFLEDAFEITSILESFQKGLYEQNRVENWEKAIAIRDGIGIAVVLPLVAGLASGFGEGVAATTYGFTVGGSIIFILAAALLYSMFTWGK